MGALVIQAFSPSSTYASPSRRAVVAMAAGSEPADDSVRPKHPISLPALAATEPEALLAQFEHYMQQPNCSAPTYRMHVGRYVCVHAEAVVCEPCRFCALMHAFIPGTTLMAVTMDKWELLPPPLHA